MRKLFAIASCFVLCSCWEDQQQAVAQCDVEAMHTYPKGPDSDIGHYIIQCMRARGYEWHWSNDRCEPTFGVVERNPYCYVPSGTLSRIIFEWEMKQRGVGIR